MMKRILFAFFVLSMALSATAQRVYINPGQGDWGPLSRPMATVNYAAYDTLGFFESNTNLWKAFALQEKLVAAGYTVMMSRTENGPYPYVEGNETIDKPVLDIGAEANLFEADYFISIHSNAYEDGALVNYPLFLYAGTDDGENIPNSISMATAAWPRHFEAFGNDEDWQTITHGFEPNTNYSPEEPNLRGDESFYKNTGLGVLEILTCPGYLVEGYFHTYQPARHRALNPDWCRQEGIRYFRGIQDYYKKPGEKVGYIMGCVRDKSEWFSHEYYHPMLGTYDPFKPINGAKVVLRDAQGNIIRTECYRHVARHITDQYYYTTDDNYNGIFVFENLQPDTYSISVHASGYKDYKGTITVYADKTVYPEIFLEQGEGTDPDINIDVKWVLNGGTVDGTLPSKIEGSEYPLPTPTRAGYIFQGWYKNAEGTGEALTTIPVGYKGTVYAIWRPATVTWELNGGEVYPDNQWLWVDFQNYFNEYYKTSKPLQPITNVLDFWNENFDIYWKMLVEDPNYETSDYWWLGHYLWSVYYDGVGGEQWWRESLAHFFNNVDPKVWRASAKTQGADSRFFNPITLPDQITSDYTIPTPEKAGATFQGWYDNPHGMGDRITVLPEGYEGTVYAIWEGQVPCIVAYDLNCKYKPGDMAFDFSFYANTQPTSGKLIFYTKNGQTTKEIELNDLHQGKNTVSIQAARLRALGLELGKDIYWEVHLEARPSNSIAEIFRSQPFNTAYATIDNSPASDFFGSIWVASQQNHGYNNITDGEIWRLIPEQGYAREGGNDAQQGHRPHRPGNPNPNTANEKGFEVIFRPTVAPDGKVYLTDNGPSYGGVFVMDPHTKKITNFFEGCTYKNGEWKKGNQIVGSGSTGAHIYWTEDGNNKNGFSPTTSKLFLMHNDHAENAKYSHGSTQGFFVYNLMNNNALVQQTNLKHFASEQDYNNKTITEYTNTNVSDYAIVGTSRGAWVCQLRYDKNNFISDPSLTFYPSDNTKPATIFSDKGLIPGSFGSAIAVSKDEKLLAMVGGTGNIMLFDIAWSNDNTTPTLTKKDNCSVVDGSAPTITTLNFDYAGNLVATLGETYNDVSDKHKVVIFTMPKAENKVSVPARESQFVPSLVEDEKCASEAAPTTTYETVQLNRKLQSGMYNTICLPFGIDLNNLSKDHPYKNATVVEFVGIETQNVGGEDILKLNFQEVQQMQAGVPYLIKPTKDITEPVILSGVSTEADIAGKSIKPDNSVVTFKGITGPTPIEKDPKILFLVANNRLATSTGGTMQGNRGYFVIDNPQNLPKRAEIAIVKGTSSSDNNIHVDDYQPTVTKVLENGVIFIIRDGVKYNLMGARIK